MSGSQIRACLVEILHFMQPHWEFVNCHMVSYLTEKHWENYVPAEIKNEVASVEDVQNCIESVFWQNNDKDNKFNGVKQFVANCGQFYLDNIADILTPMEQLNKALGLIEGDMENFTMKEFMSEKKRHEVEITATLVNRLINSVSGQNSGTQIYIVDAGDGKGYLSSRLALQYGHRVMGIDFQEMNTENALERNRKLERVWNGLVKRAVLQQQGITPKRRGKNVQKLATSTPEAIVNANEEEPLYKTTTAFITPNLNIIQLLQQQFPQAANTCAICLTGLHTCGNLATTCLRLFHEQPQCKLICNIGCCYHLLQEEYGLPEYFENETIIARQTTPGFPMSQFLRDKRVTLGRNARMLATQSFERVTNERSTMNISLYYRALLEILICDSVKTMPQKLQVGKVRKFTNFNEYVEFCCKKFAAQNCNLHWNTAALDSVQEQYAADAHYMHLYYLLRMCFAKIIESIILLDRLLYLKELGYAESYLVAIFDAVISPRRFGLIALKEAAG